jgi:hypothetical protein
MLGHLEANCRGVDWLHGVGSVDVAGAECDSPLFGQGQRSEVGHCCGDVMM